MIGGGEQSTVGSARRTSTVDAGGEIDSPLGIIVVDNISDAHIKSTFGSTRIIVYRDIISNSVGESEVT